MKRFAFVFFLLFTIVQSSVYSQTIKSAYVLSEEDDETNIKCQFSYGSAVAATRSALRYNRIEIQNNIQGNDIIFYVNVTNTESSSQLCTFDLELQVYVYSWVSIRNVSKPLRLKALLCEKGLSGSYTKMNMQERIDQLSDVSVCETNRGT
jgi:hypothetical protein